MTIYREVEEVVGLGGGSASFRAFTVEKKNIWDVYINNYTNIIDIHRYHLTVSHP